jgi:hypothetical protein
MRSFLLSAIFCLAFQGMGWAQCQTSSTPFNNCASFGDQIDSFVLNGMASTGSSGCSTNGYGSFTSPVWMLIPGSTYTFMATVGNNVYSQSFGIWIDFNNDGFYTATENVYLGSPALTHIGSITIPSGAASTATMRMRLRNTFGNFTSSDMCTANINNYGETEDYIVSTMCPVSATINIAASNTFICQGQSTTFTATSSGATSFSWSSGASGNVATLTPASTTVYSVTVGYNGCPSSTFMASKQVSVTNIPLPVSATSNTNTLCAGTTATLSAVGASNYTWLPGNANTSSISVSPTAALVYTVVGYNGSGCPGFTTVSMQVNPSPTITVVSSATSICAGQSVTFTASGASTYTWLQNSSLTGSVFTLTPGASSNISVQGTNSLSCNSSTSGFVVVLQPPAVSISASQLKVCVNGTVDLTASGAQNFNWVNGPTGTVYTPTVSANTTYTVNGTNPGNICIGTNTVAITVLDPTVTAVASPTAVCPGGTATLTAGGADTYNWSTGFQQQEITVTPASTAVFTVTGEVSDNGLNCQSSKTVMVTVNPNPTVTLVASRPTICKNEVVTFTATGGTSYAWTNNTSTAAVLSLTPSIASTINMTVTGTDANGCQAISSFVVKVNSCNGINEAANEVLFHIYPNPARNILTIATAENTQVAVINGIGQVVKEIMVSGDHVTLDVSDLAAGVYFVTAKNQRLQTSQKLIISR